MAYTFSITKDPQAVLDYVFDWSDWLAAGETIDSKTVTVDTGLTKDSDTITDSNTSVTVWLSGGTAGTYYKVICHITTSASRQDDRTLRVRADNR